jgi:hypothetical protein
MQRTIERDLTSHPISIRNNTMKHAWIFLIMAVLVWTGCEKSTDPVEEAVLEEDVATAVAGAVGEDGGGAADQVNDAASLASTGGIPASAILTNAAYGIDGSAAIDTVYDAASGWWTATLTRTRLAPGFGYAAYVYRVYQYQFLNAGGTFQRRYIVNGDTARTINFKILRGTGYHRTPRRVHRLDSLSGTWVVTNAHLATVTITGSTDTYYRHGIDTLTTPAATRTHDNTLRITNMSVTRTRGLSPTVSGTISGTYEATITFLRGDVYKERSVTRDFTVTYTGDETRVGVGGRNFRFDRQFGIQRPG